MSQTILAVVLLDDNVIKEHELYTVTRIKTPFVCIKEVIKNYKQ